MEVKDWIKKAELNQETGELIIVFMDKSIKILTLYKKDEDRGTLYFKQDKGRLNQNVER